MLDQRPYGTIVVQHQDTALVRLGTGVGCGDISQVLAERVKFFFEEDFGHPHLHCRGNRVAAPAAREQNNGDGSDAWVSSQGGDGLGQMVGGRMGRGGNDEVGNACLDLCNGLANVRKGGHMPPRCVSDLCDQCTHACRLIDVTQVRHAGNNSP